MTRLFRLLGRHGTSDDEGAYAVLFAIVLSVMLTSAALSMDLAALSMERQGLNNALDSGSLAGAGALALPPAVAQMSDAQIEDHMYEARDTAIRVTRANHSGLIDDDDLQVDFWCAVGDMSEVKKNTSGGGCWPNDTGAHEPASYERGVYYIPCTPSNGGRCNSMTVSGAATVDYSFGQTIGFPTGTTGTVASTACNSWCSIVSEDADIMLVLDRSGSIDDKSGLSAISTSVESLMQLLEPTEQRMGLVTFGRSDTLFSTPACPVVPFANMSGEADPGGYQDGWIAAELSDDYAFSKGSLNTTSGLFRAIDCFDDVGGSKYHTDIATPVRKATQALDDRTDKSRKGVLLFMSDGLPNLTQDHSIERPYDACREALDESKIAEEKGYAVASILWRLDYEAESANLGSCRDEDWVGVTDYGSDGTATFMAEMASNEAVAGGCHYPVSNDDPSNTDGDLFFCFTESGEMDTVFNDAIATAIRPNAPSKLIPNPQVT